jgi:energy-coupling factor transporter ATP-binding protein EcfA2
VSLKFVDVGYRYAGASKPSLLGIDLELRDGTVTGLAGPSEAGKTTLCLVASGLAPRSIGGQVRGRLLLDGTDVESLAPGEHSLRVGIGFQNPATQLTQVAATVFEEVAFGPMNLGLPRDEVATRTWEALEMLRIDALAARDPRRLSGGQQQLVAMAGLLALRPDHLVLDEPTAQLDPAGTRLVADAIGGLAAAGTTILVTEQKTDVLAEVCSEVVVLDEGRIAASGPTADVLGDPGLVDRGVAAPDAVDLRRALLDAGVAPGRVEAAIDG